MDQKHLSNKKKIIRLINYFDTLPFIYKIQSRCNSSSIPECESICELICELFFQTAYLLNSVTDAFCSTFLTVAYTIKKPAVLSNYKVIFICSTRESLSKTVQFHYFSSKFLFFPFPEFL